VVTSVVLEQLEIVVGGGGDVVQAERTRVVVDPGRLGLDLDNCAQEGQLVEGDPGPVKVPAFTVFLIAEGDLEADAHKELLDRPSFDHDRDLAT
jgi:hypothetical protein